MIFCPLTALASFCEQRVHIVKKGHFAKTVFIFVRTKTMSWVFPSIATKEL